jgi:hypothetical protein
MLPQICPPDDFSLLPSKAAVIATTSASMFATLLNTSWWSRLVCENLKKDFFFKDYWCGTCNQHNRSEFESKLDYGRPKRRW